MIKFDHDGFLVLKKLDRGQQFVRIGEIGYRTPGDTSEFEFRMYSTACGYWLSCKELRTIASHMVRLKKRC